jgi:predicted nucleic acid-binding Zn ribbon protein
MQKFSDAPLTVHEDCGGELEKLISTSALKFKGSGWYVNDYGRGGHLPPKERSNGDSSKGEAKGDSKPASGSDSKTAPSESKPAAKSESKPSPKPAADR